MLAYRQAHATLVGTFDVKLYEERMKAYGNMVTATKMLAMYFPEQIVDQALCAQTGRMLRHEFFTITGTMLTDAARERYLTLLHALTRASRAERLNVPRNDDDYAKWISHVQLDNYRFTMGLAGPRAVGPRAARAPADGRP